MSENSWFRIKPPEESSPFWWLRWVPTVVVSAIVLYFFYVVGKVVIIPVLASFALAYLLNPLVYRGERVGLSRVVSSVAAIFVVSVVIGAFLAYVVPDMWAESAKAGKQISENFTPQNAARQREYLRRFSPALEKVAGDKIETFLADPGKFYNENLSTTETVDEDGKKVVANTGSVVFFWFLSSLDLLLVPFFVFYILIDFQRWRDSVEELIPPRFREPFSRLFDESGRILESYVRGQLLIGIIMAVFYGVGFWALGVPAWAGIAIIAGLLNAIPYVGTILGFTLASIFMLAEGGGWWDIAGVLGIFVAVQTLEGYVLTPKILGGRLNLHPMAVFLGLLVGGKLFGFLGIVLAIPAIAIGKVFLKFLRELYQATYFYHAGDIHASQAPSEKIEERMADAADTVLADQIKKDLEEDEDADASSPPANPEIVSIFESVEEDKEKSPDIKKT
jgi:predicted PurR-regulated permease PerM